MVRGMMDLYIETLTGTAFELRVSPFETIMSVKAKIQKLEGIPISQQHLIWQSVELDDDYCLHDYSIHDGATLKLVLAMRGGPINTRRIPMEDPALREMAEYMEANRDEILEKLPSNRQVTLLVYRDGDQLNFFRVVDRGDGTLTPLSESLSGTSMYNLYDEEEEEEVIAATPLEKLEEDHKMKEKLKMLRTKMDSLNIGKKPKKKFIPRPPSGGRPGSRSFRRISGSGSKQSGQQMKLPSRNPLPPVGHAVIGSVLEAPKAGRKSPAAHVDTETTLAGTERLLSGSGSRRSLEALESAKLKRLPSVQEDPKSEQHSPAITIKPGKPGLDMDKATVEALLQKAQLSGSLNKQELKELSQEAMLKEATRPHTSSRKKELSVDSLKEGLNLRPPTSSKGLDRILDHGSAELPGSRLNPSSAKKKKVPTATLR